MAQHDFNIANATFPSVRSDINSALTAINTTQSGTSRPASAVAGTIWLDTTSATTPTLKYYDGADDISLATLDHSANTVNWLDSTVSITGLSTTATGTVLTLTDSASTSTVNLIIDNQKEVRFNETTANGTNYIGLKAPASVSADLTFTLPVAPTADNQALVATTAGVMSFTPYTFPSSDGTADQFLKTNGSAVLSFATINAGTPTVNTYDTGTAATYTKPTTANWMQINIWGGGGSGGKGASNAPAGGGGGGAYNTLMVPFSYLVGAVTYTVGAGGASQTSGSTVGNAGGTTSVSIADYNGTGVTKTFYAYGGGAGGFHADGGRGGGGGGIYSAGGNAGTSSVNALIFGSNQSSPLASCGGFPSKYMSADLSSLQAGIIPIVDGFGGGFGGASYNDGSGTSSTGVIFNAGNACNNATYGGGGGGRGRDAAGSADSNGGSSQYGGGGGGGAAHSGTAGVGGTSQFGGSGSNGTIDANASSAGTVPAGGSGGTEGGNSGAGASGRVQFIYW
jgi:hypothetical protein